MAGTPPGTRYTPRAGTPPGRYTLQADTPPSRSSACWEIRATSGRYASYWNAFLFLFNASCGGDPRPAFQFEPWFDSTMANVTNFVVNFAFLGQSTVADPGFHRRTGGGRQPLRLGRKPIICQDFCRKLHENGRNWTEGGGGRASLVPPWIHQWSTI